jgi:hypothetical protein
MALGDIHDQGLFGDGAITIANGGVDNVVPALILGAFQLPVDGLLLAEQFVVVAPGADLFPTMQYLVAEFTGGIIPGTFLQLVIHILDATILRTDIDKTVKGEGQGIKVRFPLQGTCFFFRDNRRGHLLSLFDLKKNWVELLAVLNFRMIFLSGQFLPHPFAQAEVNFACLPL